MRSEGDDLEPQGVTTTRALIRKGVGRGRGKGQGCTRLLVEQALYVLIDHEHVIVKIRTGDFFTIVVVPSDVHGEYDPSTPRSCYAVELHFQASVPLELLGVTRRAA